MAFHFYLEHVERPEILHEGAGDILRMKKILIALVLLSLFFSSAVSRAATYYVDGACSPGGDGTTSGCGDGATRPFATLAAAVSGVPSGENTISVAAGTYSEAAVTDSVSGTDSDHLRHWLANGTVNISHRFTISGSYVKFEGFRVTSNATANWNTGTIHITGDYNIIKSNYVHDSSEIGIYTTSSADHATIDGNTITYCHNSGMWIAGTNHMATENDVSHTIKPAGSGGYDADAFRFFGSGHTFRGNWIHDILWSEQTEFTDGSWPHIDAFQTYGGSAASNCLFEKNHIFMGDTSTGTLQGHHDGSATIGGWMVEPATNLTMRNNVVEACYGIKADSGGNGLYIYNNTFRGVDTAYGANGVESSGASNVLITNNIFNDIETKAWNTGTTCTYNLTYNNGSNPTSCTSGTNILEEDPDFSTYPPSTPVAWDPSGYQLQSSSPARNSGADLSGSGVTEDYAGTSRPQGAEYDIGAYELDENSEILTSTGVFFYRSASSTPRRSRHRFQPASRPLRSRMKRAEPPHITSAWA
jgi:hypothetical protein